MDETEVRAVVDAAIRQMVDDAPEQIDLDGDLRETLDVSSIDIAEITLKVETRLDVEVADEDFGTLRTVNDFVRLMTKLVNEQNNQENRRTR